MKLNRKQLRQIILNEVFGFGKPKTFLEYLKKSGFEKRGYKFDSIDDVIDVDGKKAAIGSSKMKNNKAAREEAESAAIRKFKLGSTSSGTMIEASQRIGKIMYVLVSYAP